MPAIDCFMYMMSRRHLSIVDTGADEQRKPKPDVGMFGLLVMSRPETIKTTSDVDWRLKQPPPEEGD